MTSGVLSVSQSTVQSPKSPLITIHVRNERLRGYYIVSSALHDKFIKDKTNFGFPPSKPPAVTNYNCGPSLGLILYCRKQKSFHFYCLQLIMFLHLGEVIVSRRKICAARSDHLEFRQLLSYHAYRFQSILD